MSIRERMRKAWKVVTYGTNSLKPPAKPQEPVEHTVGDFSFLPW